MVWGHLNTAAVGAAPAFVVHGSALRPNSYPVPVALYFFDGQAYLSAQPGRFPAHPSVIPYDLRECQNCDSGSA